MSSRTRRRHRRTKSSAGKKILLGLGVVLLVIAIASGAAAGWVYNKFNDAPSIDQLKPLSNPTTENSKVFAADGSLLGVIDADITREPVKLKEIPKTLQQATIAIEDENFYEHDGVDFAAIVRAAVENAEAGEIEQGASTITQQLVRNLYIEEARGHPRAQDPRGEDGAGVRGRVHEGRDPREVPQHRHLRHQRRPHRGRRRGRLAGLLRQAASRISTLKEAALLAGLPQAPTRLQPLPQPDGATERRNQVLDAMADQGYITRRARPRSVKAKASGSSAAPATSSATSSTSSTTSSRS